MVRSEATCAMLLSHDEWRQCEPSQGQGFMNSRDLAGLDGNLRGALCMDPAAIPPSDR